MISGIDDVDSYYFQLGQGNLSISLEVAPAGPTLDAKIELVDARTFQVVAASDGPTLGEKLDLPTANGSAFLLRVESRPLRRYRLLHVAIHV